LQNLNGIKKSRFDLLSSEEDLNNIKDNIALNVALYYLQILLNKEIVTATETQLQTTLEQIEKSRKLVDAGSVARGNLLQIEAQAAQEELQLINIRNMLETSLLNLTQLLELPTPEGFAVVVPEIPLDTNTVVSGNISEIYQTALGNRPEVKSSEYKLSSSEYDLKIAKGARSPRLSLSNSFSTGYSDIRKKVLGIDPMTGPVYGKYSFADQVNDNINYGVGFSLNIPILNGWQVNRNVSNSVLGVESSRYALESTKKQLYKDIQQAFADASAAMKKYAASMKAVTSTEESFRYTEQKFNVGMVTPVDYNAAKTQLLNAQSDMSQAKYEFIFKTKVLDFYRGVPLNLNQTK
jgi:outer membrane protein